MKIEQYVFFAIAGAVLVADEIPRRARHPESRL
jgi:hypothetical protein